MSDKPEENKCVIVGVDIEALERIRNHRNFKKLKAQKRKRKKQTKEQRAQEFLNDTNPFAVLKNFRLSNDGEEE